MKRFIFSVICLLAAAGTGAMAQDGQPGTTPVIQGNPPVQAAPGAAVLKRCDLVLRETQISLTTNANGARQFNVVIRNEGHKASVMCKLRITYSWRMDHEPASAREIVREVTIPAIAYQEGHAPYYAYLTIGLPDSEIHSNKGFGSANVSVRFEADADKKNMEESEDNNSAGKSVPILDYN